MKEKVMALAMAALLALALTGCGEDRSNTNRPGSDSNNTTNNGTTDNDTNGGTVDDGVTDSNGTARNGTGRSGYGAYRDNGSDKAFNDNHGSTFGGAGEDMQRDAQQFPPTVYDSMTGNRGASGTATWRQMLENGFVHDTDGFLLDGENSCWS